MVSSSFPSRPYIQWCKSRQPVETESDMRIREVIKDVGRRRGRGRGVMPFAPNVTRCLGETQLFFSLFLLSFFWLGGKAHELNTVGKAVCDIEGNVRVLNIVIFSVLVGGQYPRVRARHLTGPTKEQKEDTTMYTEASHNVAWLTQQTHHWTETLREVLHAWTLHRGKKRNLVGRRCSCPN